MDLMLFQATRAIAGKKYDVCSVFSSFFLSIDL